MPLHLLSQLVCPAASPKGTTSQARRANDIIAARICPCLIVRMGVQHQSIRRLLADDRRSAPTGAALSIMAGSTRCEPTTVATVAHSCVNEPTTVWRTPANPYCVIQVRSRSNPPSIPRRQPATRHRGFSFASALQPTSAAVARARRGSAVFIAGRPSSKRCRSTTRQFLEMSKYNDPSTFNIRGSLRRIDAQVPK